MTLKQVLSPDHGTQSDGMVRASMSVKRGLWTIISDMLAIYVYKKPATVMPERLVTMMPTVASKPPIRG